MLMVKNRELKSAKTIGEAIQVIRGGSQSAEDCFTY
jgi:hypothetical protein